MIRSIVRQLLPYINALPFADRVAGIITPAQQKIYAGENAVTKIFPMYENTPSACESGTYISLVPDEKFRSIIYFEEISNEVTRETNDYADIVSQVRLIGWFNLKKIGNTYDADTMMRLIYQSIPKKLAEFEDMFDIRILFSGIESKSPQLFSQFTYDEAEHQFLIFPFDYGAVRYTINFRVNKCLDEITLNPNCGERGDIPAPCLPVVIKNSDNTYSISANSGTTVTLGNIKFTDSDGTVINVPAQTDIVATPCPDVCTEISGLPVAEIHDCMTPQQVTDYEAAYCPSCADATVKNSDNSYNDTVAPGATLTLPNISFTDSDGTVSSVPAVTDIVATPCAPCVDGQVQNSDNSFVQPVPCGGILVLPDAPNIDSDGTAVNTPATIGFTAKTFSQLIQADGGFYIKNGVLPDNYSSFDIDPVQANDRIWFAKYNNATLYRNTFTTLANVATIAAGANITSNPRYYNGLLYAGTSVGQIKVIDAATDTVLATVALGVSTIVESICIDTVNGRLYCVTTSGTKTGYLWQFNIVAAPNYLTYVTDFSPAAATVYVACDNVNQRIYVRALPANGAWYVYDYALNPVTTGLAILPNSSQCRGFQIDNTFNEALMLGFDAQIYRVSVPGLTAVFDSLPGCSNFSDANRSMYFEKIPWETRKYFSIAVRTGTGNRYAITTR